MRGPASVRKAAAASQNPPQQLTFLLVDFKGGGQQMIIVYDDAVTQSGSMKRTYLHYPNNAGASKDVSRGTTIVSGSSITSTNPGTGHNDATQLLTKVLSPGFGASRRAEPISTDLAAIAKHDVAHVWIAT